MAGLFAAFVMLILVSYVVLDGFDLGVGLLLPFARQADKRTLMMAAIAPVWDGNEIFLVLAGMMLFIGFPAAVAVLLPALAVPLGLMLAGLVLRGAAFELRAYAGGGRAFDMAFAAGSLLMVLGQGFALGAFIQGLPVAHGAQGVRFAGGPFSWCTPFALLVGACLCSGYALLGATWLIWRTDGATQAFARVTAPIALVAACAALLIVSAATLLLVPAAFARWISWPGTLGLLPIPGLALAGFFLTGHSIGIQPDHRPFLFSLLLFAAAFAGLVSLLWPYAVPYSLTLDDAAAATPTLTLLAALLALVMPLIYGYLIFRYRVFRGKAHAFHAEHYRGPGA